MKQDRTKELFAKAQTLLPGGVDSPVRAFRAVGGIPLITARASGARLTDVDDNTYIDYVGSWGPMILGHNHPHVVEAIRKALEGGTSFGTSSEREFQLAEMVIEALPSIEMVRFVNSGTEATMSAIRLARAFTGRDKIVKFNGCYHGHADGLLVKAGSGVATLSLPDCPGVPEGYASNTLVAEYNDIAGLETLFASRGSEIAAVIVEPVVGNMGVLVPSPGYLEALRRITASNKSLLIFDEVMTGFRLSYGGAQQLFDIDPDLTCFGKVIGGGLPVGAYGGKRHIMEMVAPSGPVYQAGTLSGNPLAMAAGIATLEILRSEPVYAKINRYTEQLCEGIAGILSPRTPVAINRVGSMFTVFFTAERVYDYSSAKTADTARFGALYGAILGQGVFFPPSQFEAAFVSYAHGDAELDATLAAFRTAVAAL